jgi:hypothetical protein
MCGSATAGKPVRESTGSSAGVTEKALTFPVRKVTTLGPLVRAMVLKADVMANPLANTTGHQGYIEPEVTEKALTFPVRKVTTCCMTSFSGSM